MRVPEIRTLIHESKLLKGNPMGDPHVRKLPVYVPPGYDIKRKEPYPVVFLLAGYSGRGARYTNDEGVFCKTLPELLDEKIEKGEMPPVLVVMPDGATRFGGSQYVNSEANGPYMDYVCDEVVSFVDQEFHTYKSSTFRGVGGHSSGGFGALAFGMMRPDRFQYICSSAGDTWYEYLYTMGIPAMVKELKKAGGVQKFIRTFFKNPNPMALLSRPEGETMMNLAICTCYTPNLKVLELKADLFFDLESGELIPEVWKRLLSWDPIHMVDRYVENLRKLKWIHLEAGMDDEYALHLGHRQLARKLDVHHIPYVLNEYPGKHAGHHYRFADRIQKMLECMYQNNNR